MIKTRFAPSPTGLLHVGGLRTALFSYLFAKHHNGTFLLRVEDTDQERFVEGGVENILTSLKWAGIEPDEGLLLAPDGKTAEKGKNGPYTQSKRLPIYTRHIEELIIKGHAYFCFCKKERLEELRAMQEQNKQATGYDGHCRTLDIDESKKRAERGEPYVVRMKMPEEGSTMFHDLIRGEVKFDNKLIDDQIILKSDGFPTYHFAVVVDDHLMEITHVIRGEEWIPSTPKHIALYEMFGWEVPAFAHLPLLVNEKKQKLSKRHGDVSVEDYKEKGYLPEALVNFVAFLGWNPGDDKEIFSMDKLIKEFSLEHASKSAAVFNVEKLNWYNKEYMMQMDLTELTLRAMPFFVNAGLINEQLTMNNEQKQWLMKVVELEKSRANTLSELVHSVEFIFADKLVYDATLLVWKKSTLDDAREKIRLLIEQLENISKTEWSKEMVESKVGEWIRENQFDVGSVLWPMRVALSGQKNSPGPFEIAAVLGKEKTLARLHRALTV